MYILIIEVFKLIRYTHKNLTSFKNWG